MGWRAAVLSVLVILVISLGACSRRDDVTTSTTQAVRSTSTVYRDMPPQRTTSTVRRYTERMSGFGSDFKRLDLAGDYTVSYSFDGDCECSVGGGYGLRNVASASGSDFGREYLRDVDPDTYKISVDVIPMERWVDELNCTWELTFTPS